MTKTEHLQRIRARCEELIDAYLFEHKESDARVAGWRATIAAIDGLLPFIGAWGHYHDAAKATDAIIAAWPEELL
jgi:hypothetical protein